MGPPMRPRYLRVWFVISVLLSTAVSGGAVYVYELYSTHMSVTGVNWEVFLNNTSMGYVFKDPSVGCGETGNCPRNVEVGTAWTDFVPFAYGPSEFNLTIKNMTISWPFEILSTSPALPVFLISGQGVVSFHIVVHLPGTSGSYSPLGEIWISR